MELYLTKLKCIISQNLMALYLKKQSSEYFNTPVVPIRNNIRNLSATNSNDAYVWK